MFVLLWLAQSALIPSALPAPVAMVSTAAASQDDEELDEETEEETEQREEAPVRRKKRPKKVVPDTSLPLPSWLATSLVGGGACLAMGAALGTSLVCATLVSWIPFINLAALAYMVFGLPLVIAGAGTGAAYELVHRVARRRAALLPLAALATASVVAGWIGYWVISIAAVLVYYGVLFALNRGPVASTSTSTSTTLIAAGLLSALVMAMGLGASLVLNGSFVGAAAGLAALVAFTGRDMTPRENGGALDLTEVPEADE